MGSPLRRCASPASSSAHTFKLLFETERGSDVTLLVGCDGSQERIPAHSWVLCCNDYFKALLNSSLNESKHSSFVFPDDQPTSFMNLIRWLYGCGCRPENTQIALDTLELAVKYLCPDLAHHLVQHLSKHLKPHNVLQVLTWGDHFVNSCEVRPSAPPLSELMEEERPCVNSSTSTLLPRSTSFNTTLKNGSAVVNRRRKKKFSMRRSLSESAAAVCCSGTNLPNITSSPADLISRHSTSSCPSSPSSLPSASHTDPTSCCRILVSVCLHHIDQHASEVLSSQVIECLPRSVLEQVLSRGSLRVASEVAVLEALYRWANAACRRQHKPLTLTGRRAVLGPMLATLPRLLTLSVKEIDEMEGLYEKDEIDFVRAHIRQEPSGLPEPRLFKGNLNRMAIQRDGKSSKRGGPHFTLCRNLSKSDILMNMFSFIALVLD